MTRSRFFFRARRLWGLWARAPRIIAVSALVWSAGGVTQAGSLVDTLAMASANRTLSRADALASGSTEEMLLVSGIEALEQNRLDDAVNLLELLVERRPDFQLAQLVYADLLSARIRPLSRFGSFDEASAERLMAFMDEARRRLSHYRSSPGTHLVPDNLILPARGQEHLIVVDVPESRLYVFANDGGSLRRVADQYVSSGKKGAFKLREGDQKTPVGVYFVTGRIASGTLPDFYGSGALPINYPNEWDMRLRRTGYGIWIHGVPSDVYSRTPQASDGCIAVANSDFESLLDMLPEAEVPVIITGGIRWVEREVIEARQREVKGMLASWRRDWESLDFERYARHYSRDFHSEGLDRSAWLTKKRRINGEKSFIQVDLSNVSAFSYPGEKDLLVVTFDQRYRSSNFSDQSKKRQYWRRDGDGQWQILFEEEARFLDVHYRGLPYSARASLTELSR